MEELRYKHEFHVEGVGTRFYTVFGEEADAELYRERVSLLTIERIVKVTTTRLTAAWSTRCGS